MFSQIWLIKFLFTFYSNFHKQNFIVFRVKKIMKKMDKLCSETRNEKRILFLVLKNMNKSNKNQFFHPSHKRKRQTKIQITCVYALGLCFHYNFMTHANFLKILRKFVKNDKHKNFFETLRVNFLCPKMGRKNIKLKNLF